MCRDCKQKTLFLRTAQKGKFEILYVGGVYIRISVSLEYPRLLTKKSKEGLGMWLLTHKEARFYSPCINQAVILALGRWSQKNQKCRVILHYVVGPRTASSRWDPVT